MADMEKVIHISTKNSGYGLSFVLIFKHLQNTSTYVNQTSTYFLPAFCQAKE